MPESEESVTNVGVLVEGKSFYQQFRKDVLIIALIVIGANAFWHVIPIFSPLSQDSSDPERGRSGLTVRTDAATGCQYLATPRGLFPRLKSDGSQMCGGADVVSR